MGEPHYVLGGLLSPLNAEEYREFKEKEWEHIYEEAAGRVADGVAHTSRSSSMATPPRPCLEAASDLDLLVLGSRGYGPVKGHRAWQRLRPRHGRGTHSSAGGSARRRPHSARGVGPHVRDEPGVSLAS